MKCMTKYVALDVHQATTVAWVRAEGGRVLARTILPTEEPAIVEFFRGMRGAIHVTFEEGTQAQWLHDLRAQPSSFIPNPPLYPHPYPSRPVAPGTLVRFRMTSPSPLGMKAVHQGA